MTGLLSDYAREEVFVMIEQKILIVAGMIYFAFLVASILKFSERGFLNKRTLLVSVLMPIILIVFVTRFNVYIWKRDLRQLSILVQVWYLVISILTEFTMTPIIHSMIVAIFCYRDEEVLAERSVIRFNKARSVNEFNMELRQVVMTKRLSTL